MQAKGGNMMKKGLLAISILVALLAMNGPASADTFNYSIDLPSTDLFGDINDDLGPYATVEVHRTTPTTADITFDSSTTGGNTFLMGSARAADVNVNAPLGGWTITSLAGTALPGFINGSLTNTSAGSVNGFGVFNQTVKSFDGFTHSHNQISFTLTNTSGGTWANAGSVLAPNPGGGYSVAIFAYACNPCPGIGDLKHGYATNSSPGTALPEPASLMLLGAGLAGIGIWKRRSTKI